MEPYGGGHPQKYRTPAALDTGDGTGWRPAGAKRRRPKTVNGASTGSARPPTGKALAAPDLVTAARPLGWMVARSAGFSAVIAARRVALIAESIVSGLLGADRAGIAGSAWNAAAVPKRRVTSASLLEERGARRTIERQLHTTTGALIVNQTEATMMNVDVGDHGDWFDYLDDPNDGSADGLPVDADELFGLIQKLTAYRYELDWTASVYGQVAGGERHRTSMSLEHACRALGPRAEDAMEAGFQQFADGFDQKDGEVILHASQLECEILVAEKQRGYMRRMVESNKKESAQPGPSSTQQ
jgi:hypothetical protein